MDRRALLASVVSAAFAVSGCTTRDSPPVGLSSVEVANRRDDPVEVRVVVETEDGGAYDQRHTLDEREEVSIGSDADWTAQRVDYSVTVSLPDEDRAESFSTADLERRVDDWGDAECYRLRFDVEPDDISTFFGWTESC